MTHTLLRRAPRAGFSLIELMIALVMMSLIMGSTIAVFRSQSRNFRIGGQRLELSQNGRYVLATVDRMLRTAGAGVATQQPMFIYGNDSVVAFNANYDARVADNCAVNTNPDAPVASVDIMTTASAAPIPNSQPAFVYPSTNYVSGACRAETIVFYFRPDSTTPVAGDYQLLMKVNGMAPEMVASNVEPYPGRAFFEYYVHPRTLVSPAPRDSLVRANAAGSGITLPLVHTLAIHGSAGDTAGSTTALADSVKAVRLSIRVTNGLTGVDRRSSDMSTTIKLPNNGLVQLQSCGDPPLFLGGGGLVATPNLIGTPPAATITWPASVDEAGGQQDVTQYNVYRKLQTDPAFGSALTTVPAGGVATYTFVDGGVIAGTRYVYGVTAQDCSPAESTMLVSGMVQPN
jgi:prepilin-type N-terminal cleavage/methylation domain-containing protein